MTPHFSNIRQSLEADPNRFNETALSVFHYQCNNNPVYARYLEHLKCNPEDIQSIDRIPFLPIRFYKTHAVCTGFRARPSTPCFTSSGTTGSRLSRHFYQSLSTYDESLFHGFTRIYGLPEDWIFLALLPSYLERNNASLVYMTNQLMRRSGHPLNGFFLKDLDGLISAYRVAIETNRKVMIIGVSFALLDLAERGINLGGATIMETGGMKGRRKELIRHELHAILQDGLQVESIHSEYGMTELFSQAYSQGNGIFTTPPWMRFTARETEDPRAIVPQGKTGGLNVIDLANIDSCAFIETQDLAREVATNLWEILGRFDHSDIRGCNLMVL